MEDGELDTAAYERMRGQLAQAQVEKEKCKAKLAKCKDRLARCQKFASELKKQASEESAEWEEKERRYQRKLKIMVKDLESRHKFRGRNKLKTADRDNHDNANRVIIRNHLRYNILPHHKFLHKSMRNWTPNDKYSYSGRLAPELCFPEDVVKKIYYDDKILPETNKCVIEWRANLAREFAKVYKGE